MPGSVPVEPPPSSFAFPPVTTADERGRVTVGGDYEPGTLLRAYRSGLFPMRSATGELTWWSPDPRGVLPLERLHVSSSMRRARNHSRTTVDAAFGAVVAACAERAPGEYVWITDEIQRAYGRLHELGWAHSVETWTVPDGNEAPELVGGLYGVAIGGFFAGESMFHRRRDASKIALLTLVELLRGGGRDASGRFIDVQWLTPHMASLGAVEVRRDEFLSMLERAIALPPAAGWDSG